MPAFDLSHICYNIVAVPNFLNPVMLHHTRFSLLVVMGWIHPCLFEITFVCQLQMCFSSEEHFETVPTLISVTR